MWVRPQIWFQCCMIHIMKHDRYQHSKKVGKYVGPVLAALFISEAVTLHIYQTPPHAQLVYLNGFVLLLFGFYLVLIHNVWTRHWPVLITLSAWGATILGLYRLFFPNAQQAPVNAFTYTALAFLAAAEIYIGVRSYKSN